MEAFAVLGLISLLALAILIGWTARVRVQGTEGPERIRSACVEAQTIVDLTAPMDDGRAVLDMVTLSDVARRIRHLDANLGGLAANEGAALVAEAIEDVRRVASSLAAALDAERSLRLSAPAGSALPRQQSARRIAERSCELNAATEDLRWLIEVDR